MKNAVYVSLFSIAMFFSSVSYSMKQDQNLPPVRLMVSNQMDDDVTLVTQTNETITLESCSDIELIMQPDYEVMGGREKELRIFTSRGEYRLDYNGLINKFIIKSEQGILADSRVFENPILIIENERMIIKKRERSE